VIEALDGANRYEAREWIVEIAREEGWLDGVDPDRHVVPHGDRSKVAIEPYLTDQWFVDTAKLVQPAIDAVRDGRTTILPESDAKVYFHWLENIEPWCISRQLWWGHQIPVWYLAYPTDQEKFVATMTEDIAHAKFDFAWEELTACAPTFSAAAAELEERIPYSCRIAEDVERVGREEGLGTGASVADDGTILLNARRDPDVLDTWFSSGIWPLGTLGWPEDTPELARYYPTSVLVTGFDIIFFWVARMMMMQLELVREVPFHTVYVHALVRDEKGKKMSKSLGNVLDPLDLVDEFGADAVRFTLTAMAAMGRDLKLSRDRIAGYRNFVTKLWNAHRFAEMNGVLDVQNGADPDSNLQNAGSKLTRTGQTPPTATATANRWIIGETARVREEVDAALAAYRFNDAANALYAFTWGRVCDWYLEFSKPLFDGEKAEETRIVMAWVLDQCLILLHPIMPFVTEELWGLGRHRPALLALTEWPEYGAELVDSASESEMRWIISLIEGVRSVRGEMNVPAGARVPLLRVELSEAGRNALSRNEDLVLRLARLETITATDAVPKGSATIAVEGGTFALPLAEIIDIAAEKSRLSKSLDKLAREAGGLDKRLSNPRFVESAPPEVVDETRDLLAQKQEEQARLQTALARLAEAG
jgi:valyl-tRNA synthetase